jgi:hypothetical protein
MFLIYLLLPLLFSQKIMAQIHCDFIFSDKEISKIINQSQENKLLLANAIREGRALENLNPNQWAQKLNELMPEGFLILASTSVFVKDVLSQTGEISGSSDLQTHYINTNRRIQKAQKSGKDNIRILSFYEHHKDSDLQSLLLYSKYLAERLALGTHIIKDLGLDAKNFAQIAESVTDAVLSDVAIVHSSLRTVYSFISPSKISLSEDFIKQFILYDKTRIDELKENKGVLIIVNKAVLNKFKNYPDEKISGTFFLFEGKQSISLDDVELIIPLSPRDSKNLDHLTD